MTTNYGKPTVATPGDDWECIHCGQGVKQAPGGHGSTYIHADGYKACSAVGRARFLVTTVLAETDRILPVIVAHLDDLNMDTPEDEALLQQIRDLVAPWYEHVLTLRAMSHLDTGVLR